MLSSVARSGLPVIGVELNRFNVFNVDSGLPASASCVSTDQNRELLVLESDHLATNNTAVFETNGVGK